MARAGRTIRGACWRRWAAQVTLARVRHHFARTEQTAESCWALGVGEAARKRGAHARTALESLRAGSGPGAAAGIVHATAATPAAAVRRAVLPHASLTQSLDTAEVCAAGIILSTGHPEEAIIGATSDRTRGAGASGSGSSATISTHATLAGVPRGRPETTRAAHSSTHATATRGARLAGAAGAPGRAPLCTSASHTRRRAPLAGTDPACACRSSTNPISREVDPERPASGCSHTHDAERTPERAHGFSVSRSRHFHCGASSNVALETQAVHAPTRQPSNDSLISLPCLGLGVLPRGWCRDSCNQPRLIVHRVGDDILLLSSRYGERRRPQLPASPNTFHASCLCQEPAS
jgi:hypothetical protein